MRMLGSVAMPKSLELFWMKNNSDLDRISSSSGTRTRTRKRSLQQRQLRAIIRLSMIQPYSDRFWFAVSSLYPCCPGSWLCCFIRNKMEQNLWGFSPFDGTARQIPGGLTMKHISGVTKILLVELESSIRWDPLRVFHRRDYPSIWCSWERTEAWCVRAKALGSVLPWICALYIDKQHLWMPNTGSARKC